MSFIFRKKAGAAALLLSFSLILSSCGGGGLLSSSSDDAQSSALSSAETVEKLLDFTYFEKDRDIAYEFSYSGSESPDYNWAIRCTTENNTVRIYDLDAVLPFMEWDGADTLKNGYSYSYDFDEDTATVYFEADADGAFSTSYVFKEDKFIVNTLTDHYAAGDEYNSYLRENGVPEAMKSSLTAFTEQMMKHGISLSDLDNIAFSDIVAVSDKASDKGQSELFEDDYGRDDWEDYDDPNFAWDGDEIDYGFDQTERLSEYYGYDLYEFAGSEYIYMQTFISDELVNSASAGGYMLFENDYVNMYVGEQSLSVECIEIYGRYSFCGVKVGDYYGTGSGNNPANLALARNGYDMAPESGYEDGYDVLYYYKASGAGAGDVSLLIDSSGYIAGIMYASDSYIG